MSSITEKEAKLEINKSKKKLTRQQYRTLRGQIEAGDIEGAMKGLKKLLERKKSKGAADHRTREMDV